MQQQYIYQDYLYLCQTQNKSKALCKTVTIILEIFCPLLIQCIISDYRIPGAIPQAVAHWASSQQTARSKLIVSDFATAFYDTHRKYASTKQTFVNQTFVETHCKYVRSAGTIRFPQKAPIVDTKKRLH